MAVVLRLVPRSPDRGTIGVLKALLGIALRGDMAGLTLCYRTRRGVEEAIYTGIYRDRPAEAVQAAMKISWRLTQAADELRGPP
jgi:hypothetical protein